MSRRKATGKKHSITLGFFAEQGMPTLDHVAFDLAFRTGNTVAEMNRRMNAYGPDHIWALFIGPAIDRIQEEIMSEDL